MLFQGVDYFDCTIGAIISVVLIVRILLIDLLFQFSPIAFGKTGLPFTHIDYKKQKLLVDGKVLETVESARILGVTISCNLKWNNHVNDVIKRANKPLYFLVLLKRARVPADDIINFYCTTIRPVLEYCAQIFHHALPAYLSDDIERVQRRALSIISPELSYHDSLDRHGLASLYDRRMKLCTDLFLSISNPSHKLYNLLPDRRHLMSA